MWILFTLVLAQHEFTVASIRPNTANDLATEKGAREEWVKLSPLTLTMHNVSLRAAIRWAYDLRDDQIEGPGWIGSLRYDIAANAPTNSTAAEMRPMLQALLRDRFHLTLRRQTKELPVYAMTTAPNKPNKLKPSSGSEPESMRPVDGSMQFRNCSMASLAERLGARPFKVDRVVIDRTGLAGSYDFDVKIADSMDGMKHSLEAMEQANLEATGTLLGILQHELGLVFKPIKAPVESLVVERADKLPTAN